MSFLSGFKVFGQDIEKAFAWFGSPKGQLIVSTGEAVLDAAVPAAAPITALFDEWAKKAYTVESLAVAASQASGTGTQKALLAIGAISPVVSQYIVDAGVSPRTAAQVQDANDAVVKFINAMTQEATPVA